jgi:ribosomal protein L7Ae-like RNA K-turn-binding protein
VPLQAVLVAADCNPKWLTKHIPTLASTRQVPILCLKDNKGSSVRLGQLVNVRTALAIGIKARDSIINKTVDEILRGSELVANDQ